MEGETDQDVLPEPGEWTRTSGRTRTRIRGRWEDKVQERHVTG